MKLTSEIHHPDAEKRKNKHRFDVSHVICEEILTANTQPRSQAHDKTSGFRITYLLTQLLTYLQHDDKVAFASTKLKPQKVIVQDLPLRNSFLKGKLEFKFLLSPETVFCSLKH